MKVLASFAAASLALLTTAPAAAQSGYYVATPKGELTKSSLVTRTALWKCAGGTCVANRAQERDAVLCELVVQRVGALTAFSVGGTAYSDEALAKCNARAK